MERTAGGEVLKDSPLVATYRRLSFFPTPPWVSRLGAELLLTEIPTARRIWEPACGQGHMVKAIRPYFSSVLATDIHDYDRGYGVFDFLGDDPPRKAPADIITNPPFPLGQEFVEHGLSIGRSVSCVCRLAFLESRGRHELMDQLTVIAPLTERARMTLGRWEPKRSSATVYAWFIWINGRLGERKLVLPPPGTKARLTYESDIQEFS